MTDKITVDKDTLSREGYSEIVSQDGYGGVILRSDEGDLEHFKIRDSYSGWSIPTECGKVLEFGHAIDRTETIKKGQSCPNCH